MLVTGPSPARSRFSKALPLPPLDFTTSGLKTIIQSPGLKSLPQPPLPLPPYLTTKMPSATMITRRPVGGGKVHERDISIASASSVYSDSPGLRGRDSGESHLVRHSSVESIELDGLPAKANGNVEASLIDKVEDAVKPQNRMHSNSNASSKSSPPRPEIWKRRSVHSDRSVLVFDLKLTKSNGFTESPPNIGYLSPPPEQPLPAIPKPLPRSIGLPANPSSHRKPIPVRPAPPQPDTMGNKQSKIGKKPLPSRGLLSEEIDLIKEAQQSSDTSNGNTVSGMPSIVGSIGTFPAYNAAITITSDNISAASNGNNIIKPTAATPKTIQPLVPPVLDLKTGAQISSPTEFRAPQLSLTAGVEALKHALSPKTPLKMSAPRLNPFSSPVNGPKSASSFSTFKLNSPSLPDTVRGASAQPSPPHSTHSDTAPLPPLPPKDSTVRSASQLSPPSTLSPPYNKSTPSSSPTSRDMSIQAMQLKAKAPFNITSPAPLDKVQRAPAVLAEQLDCFLSHRNLRSSQNSKCAVACMLCEKMDNEKRFACIFCHLRICEPCVKGLTETPGRSAEHFLSRIGRKDRIPQRPKMLDWED